MATKKSTATNLTYRGYPSSVSGYTASGPAYNQGISRSTTTTGSSAPKYNQGISGYSSVQTGGSTAKKSTAKASTTKSKSTSYSTPSSNYDMSTGQYYSTPSYSGNYDMLTGESLSSSSEPSYDATGAYRKLLEAYKGRENEYQNYLNQMNEVAQGAYDRGMSSLNDSYQTMMDLLSGSYNTQRSTLEENLNRAKNNLLNTYNNSRGNLSRDAESSLKQAYLSNMLQKRDIAQKLSAMGLNGGMTESTLAGLANNYGNARNDINKALATNLANLETNYNSNLSDLEGNYSSSLADALAAYNSAQANANAQKLAQIIELENALANNKMNAYSNYQNLLSDYNSNYYNILRNAIADQADLSSIM